MQTYGQQQTAQDKINNKRKKQNNINSTNNNKTKRNKNSNKEETYADAVDNKRFINGKKNTSYYRMPLLAQL